MDYEAFPALINELNDSREVILVSYLSAVSQFSLTLFESLKQVSELNSSEFNSDVNIAKHSQCFRTDFEGKITIISDHLGCEVIIWRD